MGLRAALAGVVPASPARSPWDRFPARSCQRTIVFEDPTVPTDWSPRHERAVLRSAFDDTLVID